MCAAQLEPEFKEWREWKGWDYEYCTLCNCWNWNGKHPNTDVHKRNVQARMWRKVSQLGPGHRLGGAARRDDWDPDYWTWNAPADKEAEVDPAWNAPEDYEVCEACQEPCNGMCPRVQKLLIMTMPREELEKYLYDKVVCMWSCPTCRTGALRPTCQESRVIGAPRMSDG
jgi:hypothetical protein